MEKPNKLTKKHLLLAGVLMVIATSLWLWFAYGRLEITLPDEGDYKISIFNQANGRLDEIETNNQTVTRLARRGDHEILVEKNGHSYFAVLKVGGFLSKTSVQTELQTERQRQFVGHNPGNCVYISGRTLLSSACNDRANEMSVHKPATSRQPTYTTPSPTVVNGSIQGVLNIDSETLLVIKAPDILEDQGPPHGIYKLSSDGNLSFIDELEELIPTNIYRTNTYGENGFIAYSLGGDHVVVYKELGGAPENIGIPESELNLHSVHTLDNDGWVFVYSDSVFTTRSQFETRGGMVVHHEVAENQTQSSAMTTELFIRQNGEDYSIKLNETSPEKIKACGAQRLCVVNDNWLTIYDISDDKARQLLRVSDTHDILYTGGDNLIVARTKQVINLDISNATGYSHYSLGGYGYCGLAALGNNYAVCITAPNGKRSALLINTETENANSIDQKIYKLLQHEAVSDINIYGRYISVTPELGEIVFVESEGTYGYDPSHVRSVVRTINQLINQIEIDSSTYRIRIPFD